MNTTRTNVSFYKVDNGYSEYFGQGREITLGNGNTYALIKNCIYKVETDGNTNRIVLIYLKP